jgi:hypothetical protein
MVKLLDVFEARRRTPKYTGDGSGSDMLEFVKDHIPDEYSVGENIIKSSDGKLLFDIRYSDDIDLVVLSSIVHEQLDDQNDDVCYINIDINNIDIIVLKLHSILKQYEKIIYNIEKYVEKKSNEIIKLLGEDDFNFRLPSGNKIYIIIRSNYIGYDHFEVSLYPEKNNKFGIFIINRYAINSKVNGTIISMDDAVKTIQEQHALAMKNGNPRRQVQEARKMAAPPQDLKDSMIFVDRCLPDGYRIPLDVNTGLASEIYAEIISPDGLKVLSVEIYSSEKYGYGIVFSGMHTYSDNNFRFFLEEKDFLRLPKILPSMLEKNRKKVLDSNSTLTNIEEMIKQENLGQSLEIQTHESIKGWIYLLDLRLGAQFSIDIYFIEDGVVTIQVVDNGGWGNTYERLPLSKAMEVIKDSWENRYSIAGVEDEAY